MSWVLPLAIGLMMGLIFAWPVLGFAGAFRLLAFPDLTLEGSFPTGAAVCGIALINGCPVIVALALAIAAGALLGAMTAAIHIHFGVNKFLAGIIVVAISYTLDLRVMNASNIGLIQTSSVFDLVQPVNGFVSRQLPASSWIQNFQIGTVIFLGLLLLIGCVAIARSIVSRRGIRLRVAGSNPEYARAIGISVPLNLIFGLAFTNALCGGAGALLAMYQGFSDISMGQGVLILALASMTIGERLVPERLLTIPTFVIVSAVVGSLTYQVAVAYSVRLGLAATDLKMATALFVLAVIIFRIRAKDDSFLEVLR